MAVLKVVRNTVVTSSFRSRRIPFCPSFSLLFLREQQQRGSLANHLPAVHPMEELLADDSFSMLTYSVDMYQAKCHRCRCFIDGISVYDLLLLDLLIKVLFALVA